MSLHPPLTETLTESTPARRVSRTDAIAGALSTLFRRYIAAEHICSPPASGGRYIAVPASHRNDARDGDYICPECDQTWRCR